MINWEEDFMLMSRKKECLADGTEPPEDLYITDAEGAFVAGEIGDFEVGRRIVLCVNTLAGMDDDQIESAFARKRS